MYTGFRMNEFTIKQLIILKNGIDYLPNSVNISTQLLADCAVLLEKLDNMINTYCAHDEEIGIDYPAEKCMKCERILY